MLPAILNEADILRDLQSQYPMSADLRLQTHHRATELVEDLRRGKSRTGLSGLTGKLLSHYSLGEPQALALMELAEAFIRTPDDATRYALAEDKIAAQIWLENPWRDWLRYDMAPSVKASAYALAAIKRLLQISHHEGWQKLPYAEKSGKFLRHALCSALAAALSFGGEHFVAADTIETAYRRCTRLDRRFSFDMLGEAARTEKDALRYFAAYKHAIEYIGERTNAEGVAGGAPQQNKHGISVKLSALYGRYELLQAHAVQAVLLPRLLELAEACKAYNIGLTIDAEEVMRLELSLGLVEELLKSGICRHWQGLSVVVQAYNKRADYVIDNLCDMARRYDSLLAIRLVKGAYWDWEVKQAQSKGLPDFHTYTLKNNSDVAYICAAAKLLQAAPLIYPQFATHNAYSMAAVSIMAEQFDTPPAFEFQRIYGMGEVLHERMRNAYGHPYRVYVPVGAHDDLLPYLIRRMLENGAAGSFVNQFADAAVEIRDVVADPLHILQTSNRTSHTEVKTGAALFLPQRKNSRACDLDDMREVEAILKARDKFIKHQWSFADLKKTTEKSPEKSKMVRVIENPCAHDDKVGTVQFSDAASVKKTVKTLSGGVKSWSAVPLAKRAMVLHRVADLYEANMPELLALLAREAGKTLQDAVDEVREAVDFCRYYAEQAKLLPKEAQARGVVVCISPWNFPLAIFTGQIAAALAGGNAVAAKPAEQTPLIGARAVQLMHEAGVPQAALQAVFLEGEETSEHLIKAGVADMVAFTGSGAAAKIIEKNIISSARPSVPLVAETGGINAMVIDSTALLERAVDDVIASAYGSCGQRCSALRVVYVQEDIYEAFVEMLCGAMDLLRIGDARAPQTDIGALIDKAAYDDMTAYIKSHKAKILHQTSLPKDLPQGYYVAPTLMAVRGIADVEREVFAPVLHIASFAAGELSAVAEAINACGYGLTFGLHSRLRSRCASLSEAVNVGNIYINRNQVGAVVGSQPFGGCGLSGTGPKAGGELYVAGFCRSSFAAVVGERLLPGVEGEENSYRVMRRRVMLCGDDKAMAVKYAAWAVALGCAVDIYCKGISLNDFGVDIDKSLLACHGDYSDDDLRKAEVIIWGGAIEANGLVKLREAASKVRSDIVPFSAGDDFAVALWTERHVSADLTAIGGNPHLWSRI